MLQTAAIGVSNPWDIFSILSVHLENGKRVYFTASSQADNVANPSMTTDFNLCPHDEGSCFILITKTYIRHKILMDGHV